ncbi:branched-chain amino acid transport system permease protein [Mesorhizobium sp. J18]|uniref:branched-chain amino acid ABC transporter permease n=1 Tax=Mesorhizobium sp. J18 TaxID=935263 RepID=UPI001198ED62|nr:branched-chain amino acid ABC transporter permease [Mesorhizobium sp. J18]TWG94255.1 branched-chain amino acid transport system permease protein [Mesorhizobium sp. J18]
MLIEQFLQALTSGILLGCIYGLMCVGLAFIFGTMGVINFAQADFMMVGMYLVLAIAGSLLAGTALGAFAPFLAAFLVGPLMFGIGYLLHRGLIVCTTGLRIANQIEAHQAQLILTLGVALVLQNGALILLGSAPASIISPLSYAAWEIPLLYNDFNVLFVNKAHTYNALICVAVTLSLYWLIRNTRVGKSLRASADNPTAAVYMGIDVDRAHRIAFGFGTAIAGLAGGLIVLYYPVQPLVGMDFLIIMYAGVVLGGLGSLIGAFWGGFVIALVQQLATLVLPLQLQNATVFIVFLLVLLLRPQGFFGRTVDRA